MPFLRQSYRQKPQAWGPPSAVQASIFKNAETMGVNPAFLKLNYPLWSRGDQIDMIRGKASTPINTVFDTAGVLGSGLFFNDISSYIPIGSIGLLRPAGAPLTVLCFGHATALDFDGVLIGCRQGSGAGDLFKLARKSSVNLEFQYDPTGSGAIVGTSSDLLFESTFYCAAGRYDGKTIDLLTKSSTKNFTKIVSANKPSAAIDQDNYTIGCRSDVLSEYLQGWLCGVELYDCALTDCQIAFRFDHHYFLLQRVAPVYYSIPASLNLTQYAFRFRNDDGNEAAATYAAAENTNVTLAPGSKTRIRIGINATGDPTSKDFQLEYRHKPSGGSFGSWGIVP